MAISDPPGWEPRGKIQTHPGLPTDWGVRCRLCGASVDDGRPIIFHEDGSHQCGILTDCYARAIQTPTRTGGSADAGGEL